MKWSQNSWSRCLFWADAGFFRPRSVWNLPEWMYCQNQGLKTPYRICCPCELRAFPSHQGEEMPALIVCQSCGWTEAKEILLSPSPLPPPPKILSLGGKKLLTQPHACMHTQALPCFPVTCLLPRELELLRSRSWGDPIPSLRAWDQMNKVSRILKILTKSSRRRKRWREELKVEEEGESRELCDMGGLCRLHLCTGGKETGMLLLAWR